LSRIGRSSLRQWAAPIKALRGTGPLAKGAGSCEPAAFPARAGLRDRANVGWRLRRSHAWLLLVVPRLHDDPAWRPTCKSVAPGCAAQSSLSRGKRSSEPPGGGNVLEWEQPYGRNPPLRRTVSELTCVDQRTRGTNKAQKAAQAAPTRRPSCLDHGGFSTCWPAIATSPDRQIPMNRRPDWVCRFQPIFLSRARVGAGDRGDLREILPATSALLPATSAAVGWPAHARASNAICVPPRPTISTHRRRPSPPPVLTGQPGGNHGPRLALQEAGAWCGGPCFSCGRVKSIGRWRAKPDSGL